VKKRRIHTCIKITDCQINWEMEKLRWQIDEKKGGDGQLRYNKLKI
jgi:hypothetical protein